MPDQRAIVLEAEPGEILENCRLVLRSRTLAIVVLNAKQDPPIAVVRGLPHVEGIDDVAEVQKAGGGWREACNHEPPEDTLPPFDAAFAPLEPGRPHVARAIGV